MKYRGTWLFTYKLPSWHYYAFNEYNNANEHGFRLKNPGPWLSFEKGQVAMEEEFRLRIKDKIFSSNINYTEIKNIVEM
jgi:hypothetical protein